MLNIQYGMIPNSVYVHEDADTPKPEHVDTDPSNKIALKYKKKTDEWTKYDFYLIRHMMPCYFAIPLAIAGLATAVKIASSWTDPFRARVDDTTILVPSGW